MTRKKLLVEKMNRRVKVINQDLRDEYGIDSAALGVMECLEDKVSQTLLELLKIQLLGFGDDMQLEIADDLLDFAYGHVIHSTGCPSADMVLENCYTWIAAEHGIQKVESILKMFNN